MTPEDQIARKVACSMLGHDWVEVPDLLRPGTLDNDDLEDARRISLKVACSILGHRWMYMGQATDEPGIYSAEFNSILFPLRYMCKRCHETQITKSKFPTKKPQQGK